MLTALIIAEFKNGTAAYVRTPPWQADKHFTKAKHLAWRVHPDTAEEEVRDRHAKMESGYWPEVSYFRWAHTKSK